MTHPYTPAQLEAWAGLGPWLKQYSPTIDAMQIIETVERDSEGNVPIPRKIAHVYEGQRMDMDRIKLHSDALAAAPNLARLVLEKDAEIARLKAAAADLVSLCSADVKMNGTTYQPMPYRSAFTNAVDRMIELINETRQAMKETSDE